jgi:serine/threonine protein kinase
MEPVNSFEPHDPNPSLIKESDLMVNNEMANLRDYHNGETVFVASLWGRPVTVRKLQSNNNSEVVNTKDKLRLDFLRELQVLTDFRHANILPLQGFSFWPMMLVYPLLPTRMMLSDIMYNPVLMKSLTWAAKLRIVSSISNALSYVHYGCPELSRPGIVHRFYNLP